MGMIISNMAMTIKNVKTFSPFTRSLWVDGTEIIKKQTSSADLFTNLCFNPAEISIPELGVSWIYFPSTSSVAIIARI